MAYALETTPDGDTTWGQDTRDFAISVGGRLDLLEVWPINAQTGTTYTLVITDVRKQITRSNAAANTTTVPPNSAVAFPVGTRIRIRNIGAGIATIVAGAGVTLQSEGAALQLAGQFAACELEKNATDTWWVDGNLV
jgi:hypothetical protein